MDLAAAELPATGPPAAGFLGYNLVAQTPTIEAKRVRATGSLARGDLLHPLARKAELAADVLERAAGAEFLSDGSAKFGAGAVGIGHRASVRLLSSLEFGLSAHTPPRPTEGRARSVRSRLRMPS
jgi:hypothetical protein